MPWVWLSVALTGCILLSLLFWWIGRGAVTTGQAREHFHGQRAAVRKSSTFRPRRAAASRVGCAGRDATGRPGVEFAREMATGRLAALAGVTIQFEAIEGGDMEGLPAVGNLRNASAVFFFHAGQWHTTGKTVFNLNPDEVLAHFQNLYERLAE